MGVIIVSALLGVAINSNASAVNVSDYLTINPEYSHYIQDVNAGRGANWGLIPDKYGGSSAFIGGRGGGATLPARYSLNENGLGVPIKNQGTDSICWAYATTSAIESQLKKSFGVTMEFSPKQLDYLLNTAPYRDYLVSIGLTPTLGGVGNFTMAALGLSSQYAPIAENAFFAKMKANDSALASFNSLRQYNDNSLIFNVDGTGKAYDKPMPLSSVMVKSDYVVTDYKQYFGLNADTLAKVKQDIYENGAVYAKSFAPESENCWDEATKTIIDKGETVCGSENYHALLLIGWDDNYQYTDPVSGTTKTGAFLVQNSWGDSSLYTDYGITTDVMMNYLREQGYLDGKTESEIDADRILIEDDITSYDAEEYVHLGYDYNDEADFGVITSVKPNVWSDIYDVTNANVETSNENGVFRWTVNDKVINGISFVLLAPLAASTDYTVTLDTGNEKITKTQHVDLYNSERTFWALERSLYADGNVTVTVSAVVDGVPAAVDDEIVKYMVPVLYMNEPDDVVVPDTGTGVDVDVDGVAVPNTGIFTADGGGLLVGGAVFGVVLGVSIIIVVRGYKSRKSILHPVDFNKR